MELWLVVLALYFAQDSQRICRCDYCWGYFIPKTKKVTRYCDRVTDGQSCKQRGANLKRLEKSSEDEALLIYKKLRDRMYARLLRWQDAPPFERSKLIPMDYEQYDRWSENARIARMEYVQGTVTTEKFLRKIDTTHELTSYEVEKVKLLDEPSVWQRLVARNFRFDLELHFPKKMMHLNFAGGYLISYRSSRIGTYFLNLLSNSSLAISFSMIKNQVSGQYPPVFLLHTAPPNLRDFHICEDNHALHLQHTNHSYKT